LPKANEVDLDDVPQEIRDELEFVLVEHLDEVLERAIVPEVEFEVVMDEAPEGGNGHSKKLVAEMLA
jgi:hypothetical protein